jgi:peptidylprolyl isomerase
MITLTRTSILALLFVGAASLSAQTTAPAAKAPVHHTATATAHPAASTAGSPCASNLPKPSAKVPAVPAGTPCAKALLTFSTAPNIKLDYVSPLVSPEVREALGLAPVTFTLGYAEVKVGTGELALPRKYYTVNYSGYLLDGTNFDASSKAGKPFTFPIGARRVIPGWDLGLQGIRVGGKRRLFIPWQLAYGDKGNPGGIPPRADLIFDVELLSQSDTDPDAKAPTPDVTTPKPAAGATTPPATAPQPAAKPASPPPTQSTTPDSAAKPQTPKQ